MAADGGIFTFGDAGFHGSLGGTHLDAPVVAMAIDPVTGGYWLIARDGGVFSFTAPFYGSDGGHPPAAGASGMVVAPTGLAYAIVTTTGSSVSFGS